jgi:site-specific DNA recombinase
MLRIPTHAGKTMDGYVRVSRQGSRGEASFYSPSDQAEMITLWAARNEVIVDKIHEDIDWSGQTMHRPAFAESLKRIDSGASSGLIVAMLDRFGRDTAGVIGEEKRIRAAGGVLVNLDGEFDTSTPEGEYMFGIFSMNATLKGRQIQRGWQRAHANHVAEGVPTRVKFGYRRRGEDGCGRHPKSLVILPEQAVHVEPVFQARARGDSFDSIAKGLNERGIRTSTGSAWSSGSVASLIRSRTYLGQVHVGGLVNADAHEPLVSEALWQAAQTGGTRAYPKKGSSLLTGLVRCAGCRYALESSAAMDRYRCAGRHAGGTCPEPVSIRRALLDDYVWAHMVRRVQEEQLALEARRIQDGSEREAIERDLSAARAAEDAHLGNLDLQGIVGQRRFNDTAAKHRMRVEELERRLGDTVSAEISAGDAPNWAALARAPLDVRRDALAHGLDVVFLRGRPGRGGNGGLDPERVLILERGQGPSREQLPRRGPRGACEFACVPFAFPHD